MVSQSLLVWDTLGGSLNLRPFKESLSVGGTDRLRSRDLDRVPGRICQQLVTEFLFSDEKQDEVKQ